MSAKKKIIWITTFIIITAIIIVICVTILNREQMNEFDGTLVNLNYEFPNLI